MKSVGTRLCNKLCILSVAPHLLYTHCAVDREVSVHLKTDEALLPLWINVVRRQELGRPIFQFPLPCDGNLTLKPNLSVFCAFFLGKEGWERMLIVICQQVSAGRSRPLLLASWQSPPLYHAGAWFLAQTGCLKEHLAGLAGTRTFYSNMSKMLLV